MIDRRSIVIGLAGAALCGTAMAQTLPGIGGNGGLLGGDGGGLLGGGIGDLGGQDSFRTEALQDGSYSVQASTIAIERSKNARVRQFAQLEINEQVAIAAALGTTLQTLPLKPEQAARVVQLQNASDQDFDRLYIEDQLAGHEELLNLNGTYSQNGGNLAERRVAVVAVPTIQAHISILQRL